MARIGSASSAVALLLAASTARAGSQLLFLEAQGVAGYSSAGDKAIYYSMDPDAEMQKPSVGVDYLRKLSGEGGDWGSVAFQGRLALVVDDGIEKVEPQVYNAWLKVKTPLTDVWVGHNRPAIGLGSYFDSHALLLPTLAMQGFGYDRDWGIGTYRDFRRGNLQVSATTGSGMPVYFHGNYLLAARAGYGVLNEDNYTVGVSAGCGDTLETMGYKLHDSDPKRAAVAGVDAAFLWNRFEHRADLLTGEWLGEDATAVMYRLGIRLDAEERVKVEAQPTYWTGGHTDWQMAGGVSWRLTADLTFRAMYEYSHDADDHRVIGQLYYYRNI